MHGLINRAIQGFVRDTYGQSAWADIRRRAGLDFAGFEAMLRYDDAVTRAVLDAVAARRGVARAAVLEDIGTYLVSHPNVEALRRLLRFGGVGFVDFLHSLDDLPDRARLAVPDLDLPGMCLADHGNGRFSLTCLPPPEGFGHVMVGILRAMADDYGALVYLEHRGLCAGGETVDIALIETAFAAGRRFDLGGVGDGAS